MSKCLTKPPSTGRRSTSRSGARSGASSASRPIKSTSPSRPRFGLVYKTRENTEATPLCIHRAPLGTHERFIGFLIEHYAGNFPLWLAPEQVRVLPIGDEAPLLEYARAIQAELRAHEVRAELDASSDHIKAKIASAEQMKVHTMLVIGNRDMEANAVSVRVHGKGNLGAKPRAEVLADLLAAIKERRPRFVRPRLTNSHRANSESSSRSTNAAGYSKQCQTLRVEKGVGIGGIRCQVHILNREIHLGKIIHAIAALKACSRDGPGRGGGPVLNPACCLLAWVSHCSRILPFASYEAAIDRDCREPE